MKMRFPKIRLTMALITLIGGPLLIGAPSTARATLGGPASSVADDAAQMKATEGVNRGRLTRDDEVVLEPPGAGGEVSLGLQVRADPAAALAVEHRHVDDPQAACGGTTAMSPGLDGCSDAHAATFARGPPDSVTELRNFCYQDVKVRPQAARDFRRGCSVGDRGAGLPRGGRGAGSATGSPSSLVVRYR